MKKITLFILTLLTFNFNYAQDTCATAQTIAENSTVSVTAVNGTDIPIPDCAPNAEFGPATAAEWYVFTASTDGVATVTSDLPGSVGGDTRLHIYTGTCAALTCIAGADDIDYPNNNLSVATFAVSNAETYYIAWDDLWGVAAFDFSLTVTAVDCTTSFPIAEGFDDANTFAACFTTEDGDGNGNSWVREEFDVNGDLTNETFATNGSNGDPTPKNDWLFSPAVMLTMGSDYDFSFKYNGFDSGAGAANEDIDIVLIDAPSSSGNVLATLGSITGITQNGASIAEVETAALTFNAPTYTSTMSGTYYIGFNSKATGPSGFLLIFDYALSETLSLDEFSLEAFKHYYDKSQKALHLESAELPIDKIEVYSLLGQSVLVEELSETNEIIDVSGLTDGMYLTRVSINGNTETFKFVKN